MQDFAGQIGIFVCILQLCMLSYCCIAGDSYRWFAFRLYKGRKGVSIMSAYEILMIMLTFISILVAVCALFIKN